MGDQVAKGTRAGRHRGLLAAVGAAVLVAAVALGVAASPGGNRYEWVLLVQPAMQPLNNQFPVLGTHAEYGILGYAQVPTPSWKGSCAVGQPQVGTVVTRGIATSSFVSAPTWIQIECRVPSPPTKVLSPTGRVPGTGWTINGAEGVVDGQVVSWDGCVLTSVVVVRPSLTNSQCQPSGT